MKYYRPFCKIVTYSGNSFTEINFQDTGGEFVESNYINIGVAGSMAVADIYEVELIGTSGLRSFCGSLSSTNASGGFATVFTHSRPLELILPTGISALGFRFVRSAGTGSRVIYVNYGVLKDEQSPLKANNKYKGV